MLHETDLHHDRLLRRLWFGQWKTGFPPCLGSAAVWTSTWCCVLCWGSPRATASYWWTPYSQRYTKAPWTLKKNPNGCFQQRMIPPTTKANAWLATCSPTIPSMTSRLESYVKPDLMDISSMATQTSLAAGGSFWSFSRSASRMFLLKPGYSSRSSRTFLSVWKDRRAKIFLSSLYVLWLEWSNDRAYALSCVVYRFP